MSQNSGPPLARGQQPIAKSLAMTPATDAQFLAAGTEYKAVPALSSSVVLGSVGAVGDLLNGLVVTPATLSPGAVTLLDGSTSIPVFAGGANSVGSLIPFFVPFGIRSITGPWKVTTGASVSVVGVGDFT